MSCYFFIGDIHGEIRLLDKLLREIEPFHPDRIIFVGDFIDRGPHSRPVIDRLMNLGTEALFLIGNHEMMLLNAMENSAFGYSPIELWYYNGAEATLQSFGSSSFFSFQTDLERKYLRFFQKLKMNHILNIRNSLKIIATHAGISPAIPLSDQLNIENFKDHHEYILRNHLEPLETFIWVRDQFFNAPPALWDNHLIVHGHTPVNKLRRFVKTENEDEWEFFNGDLCIRRDPVSRIPVSIDIDAGSTISGRLTGLGIIETENKIQFQSITVSSGEILKRELFEL